MRKLTPTLLTVLAACICTVPALAQSDFTWVMETHVQTAGEFAYLVYHGTITNTGTERDSYEVNKEQFLPDDFIWSASICIGDFCYAPFIDTVVTDPVDPGGTVDMSIDIVVGMEVATGYATLEVGLASGGGPDMVDGFVAIHTDCDLLLVDDYGDAFNAWTNYDILAPALAGKTIGHWPRSLQLPTLPELQSFPSTFWLCGGSLPTLEADDRALLGSFLDDGGSLLVGGEDVAYDLCDPSSPNYSTESASWVDSFFDITYEMDDGGLDVVGLSGTDIGDGLAFSLGNGADPDVVSMSRAAATQFECVGAGATGILRTDIKRLLFLGFDLVDVPGAELATLLGRACVALAAPTASGTPALPGGLVLRQNQPNPFNPKTNLRFSAPAAGRARIAVMDVTGRRVAGFVSAVIEGENVLPFTATGLASGTYLYLVRLGDEVVAGKMTLIK